MAAALKLFFSPQTIGAIATSISHVWQHFDREGFVRDCCLGIDDLELMPRAQHISRQMRVYLPRDYDKAVEILMLSLGPVLPKTDGNGLAPFFYLPHVFFVRDHGLEHFVISMAAQYELTRRFTAEFSIRPFIARYCAPCMTLLEKWACDPCEHVRRLVSEGTRPRLPWAAKLDLFITQPHLTRPLLESLKDDTSLYVRRSVANHLNDISKDNLDYALDLAQDWAAQASPERRWVIKHGLRSLVKKTHPRAIQLMGFAGNGVFEVLQPYCLPAQPSLGGKVQIGCLLKLAQAEPMDVLVDLSMEFPGRNAARVKVFKLTQARLSADTPLNLVKHISLAPMSTRTYYPGQYSWTLLVNGEPWPLLSVNIS